jgi:hypothetical protein
MGHSNNKWKENQKETMNHHGWKEKIKNYKKKLQKKYGDRFQRGNRKLHWRKRPKIKRKRK